MVISGRGGGADVHVPPAQADLEAGTIVRAHGHRACRGDRPAPTDGDGIQPDRDVVHPRIWQAEDPMAKGARRIKGPFQGKIDLFYRDEIVFLRSKRSDLHLLHDCFLEEAHAVLRQSVESLTASHPTRASWWIWRRRWRTQTRQFMNCLADDFACLGGAS